MDLTQLNILLYKQPSTQDFTLPLTQVGDIPIINSNHSANIMLYIMDAKGPTADELFTIQQAAKKMPVVIALRHVEGPIDLDMTLPPNVTLTNADDVIMLEDALFEGYLRVVRAYFRAKMMLYAKKALIPYKEKVEKIWRTKNAQQQAEQFTTQFLTADLPPILHQVAEELLLPLSPKIAFFEEQPEQKLSLDTFTSNVSAFFKQLRGPIEEVEEKPGRFKTLIGKTSKKARAIVNKSSIHVADAFEHYILEQLRTNRDVADLVESYISQVKEAMLPTRARQSVNVAILGQTGVGKSSLINYLFNAPKRATGAGKPVTEQGFFEEKLVLNGIPVSLIDSWGIEQGKDQVWLADFNHFLEARGYKAAVAEWVHIAIYCISGASARVQDFDLKVIDMLREKKIHVIVALTKASLVSPQVIAELTETIHDATREDVTVIPVNSVAQKLMTGQVIEQQGLEEITAHIRVNYLEMLNERLPERIFYLANRKVAGEYRRRIEESPSSKEAVALAKQLSERFVSQDLNLLMEREVHAAMTTYASTLDVTHPARRTNRTKHVDNEWRIEALDVAFSKLEEAFRSTILMQAPPQVGRKFQKEMQRYLTENRARIEDETRQTIARASAAIDKEEL